MNRPELKLWWEPRDPSKADDAQRLANFVNGLPKFDPIYESWLSAPEAGSDVLSVPTDEAQTRRLLRDNIGRYDVDDRIWPELGSYFGAGHAGPPPHDFRKSSYADIYGRIGAFVEPWELLRNDIFMRLSDVRPSTGRPWRASELRPLMKFARDIWNPAEMLTLFSFQSLEMPKIADPVRADGARTLKPWIGWITWLPADLAARAQYPGDVEVENLADGSALVTLCEEPFDKTDAEGMARLRALQTALRPIQR